MAPQRNRNNNNMQNNNKDEVQLSENERSGLQSKLTAFINSGAAELTLPGLSRTHRKYMHRLAARSGLKTRSYGSEKQRVLHIMRKVSPQVMGDVRTLTIHPKSLAMIRDHMPYIRKELLEASAEQSRPQSDKHTRYRGEVLGIGLGPRMVPPPSKRISHELYKEKSELPIARYQDDISKLLRQHSVFIINGETGSGKTTQVPQFILADSCRRNRPCRIVVTQPRRVAATSIAARVADERGEHLGDTVGYQIRMESRVRRTTNLVYTTSGFLLRSILGNSEDLYRKISHLIIDEIHERDKHTDFTLIAIKEQLKLNKNLKVILMSATMDVPLLSQYFDNCPMLNVPGQGYHVKIYHLEDILYYTGYRTALMDKYLRLMNEMNMSGNAIGNSQSMAVVEEKATELQDEHHKSFIDSVIEHCTEDQNSTEDLCQYFDQIHYYITSEDMPVDACHSQSRLTPLMVACRHNLIKYVEILTQLRANPQIRDSMGHNALDYAAQHEDATCLSILQTAIIAEQSATSASTNAEMDQLKRTKMCLLDAYQRQFTEDSEVDHDLILSLLEGLYRSEHPGAIMVFLPGYNDIVCQRDLINSTLPPGSYRLCILHGQMDTYDQAEALKRHHTRKIILSTNIGQTSITVPDLAFIIDSGKVKMKTYDSMTESSQLCSVWISQADAVQRSGRAGRTQNGVCYRLYSTDKYQHMLKFSPPEFMRTPLTEICLYAKTLEPHCDVRSYLARALSPPAPFSVQNAIRKLQIMNVFNNDESVTLLGKHLVEMPVDVQLGKCLFFSIFLKCFDPILTIVAFHSVKDPFILPKDREIQGKASYARKQFSGESFSDHMGILELYKAYSSVRNNKRRCREFCAKHFLSQSAMEMFIMTRRKISEFITHKYKLWHCTDQNDSWELVCFCLVAGLYPNVAAINRLQATITSATENKLLLQRTSCVTPPGKKNLKDFVWDLPHDWIVFYEKSRVGRFCSINMNTIVSPYVIVFMCGRHGNFEMIDDREQCGDSTRMNKACLLHSDDDDDIDVDELEDEADGSDIDEEHNEDIIVDDINQSDLVQQPTIESIEHALNELTIDSVQTCMLTLDSWIRFEVLQRDAKLIWLLRSYINHHFNDFLRNGVNEKNSMVAPKLKSLLMMLDKEDCA